MVAEFIENLSEFAKEQALEPVIERKSEICQITEVLCRTRHCHPILIGQTGVGCSTIVRGLAQHLLEAPLPERLRGRIIRRINFDLYFACSTSLLDSLNHFIETTYDELNRTILVLDGLSSLSHANEATCHQVLDWIKRTVASYELRVMLVADKSFYNKFLKTDAYLSAQCAVLRIEAPTFDQTLLMVAAHIKKIESTYQIKIANEIIPDVVHWSQRYLLDNSLPASALDLLDASAAAICAHQTSDILTKEDVAGVLSDRQGVEKDYLLKNETQIIEYCMTTLSHRICGQRVALNAIEKTLQSINLHTWDHTVAPKAKLLFAGPSRVGKSTIVKVLTEVLYGSETQLIRFNMHDYRYEQEVVSLLGSLGALNAESTLVQQLNAQPYSICLFEHLEYAHVRFLRVLQQLMEVGKTKDYDLSNHIFIMTVDIDNLDAVAPQKMTEPEESESGLLQFLYNDLPGEKTSMRRGLQTIEQLLQRIDPWLHQKFDDRFLQQMTIIPFSEVNGQDLAQFLDAQIVRLKKHLAEQEGVQLKYANHFSLDLLDLLPQASRTAIDVKRFFEQQVEPVVSQILLSIKSKKDIVNQLDLFVDERGQILCQPVEVLSLEQL
ncbi:MAG: AAA family ATPase [Pseudomonadota bacterium]